MHIEDLITAHRVINEISEALREHRLSSLPIYITQKSASIGNWKEIFGTNEDKIYPKNSNADDYVHTIANLIHSASINNDKYKLNNIKFCNPDSADFMYLQDDGYVVDMPRTKEMAEIGIKLVALVKTKVEL